MNINGKLDLFKNSLGELKLSKKDLGSASMKTTIMSSEEKAVAMNLLLDQGKKDKAESEKQKNKKVKVTPKKVLPIESNKNEKQIERDPLALLKLF
jgi:hypothetical protein